MKNSEESKEQLKENLRKTREELAVQKWGLEKTLEGMKILVTELLQKGKEIKKFKLAVDNVSDQIIITDPDATVLYINNATETTTGYVQEEVVGKKAGKLWGNLMERSFYENLWKTIKIDKKIFIGEMINQRKNNQTYTALISISPILDERGKIEFFVGIERDITKEKEIDRAKTEFVSLASHQLRTPLSAIKWYSKMLLDEDVGKTTEKQKEYLEEIHGGNERMVSLVNALLNVSRIEMGAFAVVPKKINITTVCREVLDNVKEDIESKKLNIKDEFKKVTDIEVDPSYIRIIFQNLITNAIKYTPEGGTITITISQDKTNLLISVKDTGYGIPEIAKEKIFTKLYRADNVVDKDPNGTGLGLYITKSIVEKAANGKVWFESEENKGTTFFVSLPLTGMIKQEGVKGLI